MRDRRDDIAELALYFVTRTAQQTEGPTPHIARDALSWLASHDWPGNVRELENTLFRAVALLDGDILTARDLTTTASNPPATATDEPGRLRDQAPTAPATDPINAAIAQGTLAEGIDMLEREMLMRLYPDYPSSRKLAERLGISHTAIARKLRKYGISG